MLKRPYFLLKILIVFLFLSATGLMFLNSSFIAESKECMEKEYDTTEHIRKQVFSGDCKYYFSGDKIFSFYGTDANCDDMKTEEKRQSCYVRHSQPHYECNELDSASEREACFQKYSSPIYNYFHGESGTFVNRQGFFNAGERTYLAGFDRNKEHQILTGFDEHARNPLTFRKDSPDIEFGAEVSVGENLVLTSPYSGFYFDGNPQYSDITYPNELELPNRSLDAVWGSGSDVLNKYLIPGFMEGSSEVNNAPNGSYDWIRTVFVYKEGADQILVVIRGHYWYSYSFNKKRWLTVTEMNGQPWTTNVSMCVHRDLNCNIGSNPDSPSNFDSIKAGFVFNKNGTQYLVLLNSNNWYWFNLDTKDWLDVADISDVWEETLSNRSINAWLNSMRGRDSDKDIDKDNITAAYYDNSKKAIVIYDKYNWHAFDVISKAAVRSKFFGLSDNGLSTWFGGYEGAPQNPHDIRAAYIHNGSGFLPSYEYEGLEGSHDYVNNNDRYLTFIDSKNWYSYNKDKSNWVDPPKKHQGLAKAYRGTGIENSKYLNNRNDLLLKANHANLVFMPVANNSFVVEKGLKVADDTNSRNFYFQGHYLKWSDPIRGNFILYY